MGRGPVRNVKELQLFGLEQPMILSLVTISQVKHLTRKCIRCSLGNLQKMQIRALTVSVATPL